MSLLLLPRLHKSELLRKQTNNKNVVSDKIYLQAKALRCLVCVTNSQKYIPTISKYGDFSPNRGSVYKPHRYANLFDKRG